MMYEVGTEDVVVVPGGASVIQNKGPGIITVSRQADIAADEGVTIAVNAQLTVSSAGGNEPLYLISSVDETDVRTL